MSGFRFEENTAVSTTELLKVVGIKIGSVPDPEVVGTEVERIQRLYLERGYAALVVERRQSADGILTFVLQEAVISLIAITGLKKVSENTVCG